MALPNLDRRLRIRKILRPFDDLLAQKTSVRVWQVAVIPLLILDPTSDPSTLVVTQLGPYDLNKGPHPWPSPTTADGHGTDPQTP